MYPERRLTLAKNMSVELLKVSPIHGSPFFSVSPLGTFRGRSSLGNDVLILMEFFPVPACFLWKD